MIYCKTLTRIRQSLGLSLAEFAKDLDCTEAYVYNLEANKEQASFEFVVKLKNKYNLHSSPILDREREDTMTRLYDWKVTINYGDIAKASELKPGLEKSAMSSFSPSTINMYDLLAADYYYLINDMKSYEETMTALSQRTNEFSARHWYHYNCLLGAKAFVGKHYQDAIKSYKSAEKLDKNDTWADVRFYFGLGMSLSDRGYATRAVEYLKKAKHMAMWGKAYNGKPNRRFDVYIDGYLANDLSKIGRGDEALKVLERRYVIETKNKSREGLGYTYFSLGRVYRRISDYDKAIDYFDKALEYLHVGESGHIASIYLKASSLINNDESDEAVVYAEKGMSITRSEYWKTKFDAIKHSILMHNDLNSAKYLSEIVIPKLKEYGQHEAIVYYYEQLSNFYNELGNIDIAIKCSNHALEIQKQMYNELLEGDM
ncbi:MAG: helix-turn-helix transcriptional regulator [Defluviitaleaceae bacterium]|nr:helix-turn-helix transcriptional regulator [Defluviitaleaceae bacterium]